MTASSGSALVSPRASIGPGTLAALLVRSRLRSLRNGLKARGRRRAPAVILAVGVLTALAYVGLFTQAFSVVVATVGLSGQIAALGVVTGTIALGSLAAKAASSEAVRAGSAENEFLLARPVSLPALVAGRGIADAVTDPMGALFLLPVLLAAALVWRLPPLAWLLAAAISSAVQVTIAMLGYATQLLVVRLVSPRRRRGVWMGLRLCAALALAALWLIGTWVLRAPGALAVYLGGNGAWLARTPGVLIAAPLAAMKRGDPLGAWAGLGLLWVAAAAALVVAAAVARRAGMRGWEEAGAPWAEAAPEPPVNARPLTAATKDLRLIMRDRAQLLVLIAMPAIFVGAQIFGSAGWAWSTASLARVACLAYSLALYMATIGPLTHMQAERRAFWILRTVPVRLGTLLAAKARAWAIVVGGAAAFAFLPLVALMPPAPWTRVAAAGALVVGGAAAMSFLAVAMAAGAADLSDEQGAAVGPTTIYAFLLVGGLYNLVLTGDLATRLGGSVLYLFVTVSFWQAGITRAEICLDAEAVRWPQLRVADVATLLVIHALGGRGLTVAETSIPGAPAVAFEGMRLVLVGLLGLVAAGLLRRAPPPRLRRGLAVSMALGMGLGLLAARFGRPSLPANLPLGVVVAGVILAEELIFRGALQRALEATLERRGYGAGESAAVAAAVGLVMRLCAVVVAAKRLTLTGLGGAVAIQIAAAVARAATGRVTAAWAARLAGLAIWTFF